MLNSTSGEVILNFDPLEGMKGHFEFVVTAIDPSGHLDAAKVKIYLIREDQKVRFVVRSHPSEIRYLNSVSYFDYYFFKSFNFNEIERYLN